MNYFELKKMREEIDAQALKASDAEEMACKITQNFSSKQGGGKTSDKICNAAVEQARFKELIQAFNTELENIPDAYIRYIIKQKLKYRKSWNQIAHKLVGTTSDSIRMKCTRYSW
ncbi:MAG: hypothetical protein ACI4RP_09705 [Acutalibacteraceae bacterium]